MESKEVKRLIVKRSFDFNIPLRYACNEADIDYASFMQQYINSANWMNADIPEHKFEKLLNVLGIEVRFQFVINKNIDMVQVSKSLADKYE